MLPIIKEIKQKLRTARGFTMVELMVVLLILGILAALAGTGLIAYVRLARFEHNESGARTVFQTAQIAPDPQGYQRRYGYIFDGSCAKSARWATTSALMD